MDKFRLYAYDVWGNEEGFQVNQTFRTDIIVELDSQMSDWEIINYLIEKNILKKDAKGFVEIDGEWDCTLSFMGREDGFPLFELNNESKTQF